MTDLSALRRNAREPVALKEVELNIIRWWPDGMADRLDDVWLDLIASIPNYKLYDLQRMLAEYGFTMKVYEPDFTASPSGLEEAARKGLDVEAVMGLVFRYGAARVNVDRANSAANQRECNEVIAALRAELEGKTE